MAIWLFFVIFGQFLNAIVVLADKYIVTSKAVSKPVVYTFYVSILSAFVVVLIPFGVISFPTNHTIIFSLLAAFSYVFSILFLYESLKISAPSEVVPVVGATAAISTLAASYWILGDKLPQDFLFGFIILVIGMLLISHFKFTTVSFLNLFLSGVFFGISTVMIKSIFNNDTFFNGFFWSRIANVLAALLILLWPGNLKAIKNDLKKSSGNIKLLVISNKIVAGLAFLFILLAIKHGQVSMVNALAAIQYVFLLVFAFIFTKKMASYFSEDKHKMEMLHKISATILIVIGFFLLFLN